MKSQKCLINLALVSPKEKVYSETFIKAQKDLLPFNVFYYSGGGKPGVLEGQGDIINTGVLEKMVFYLIKTLFKTKETWREYKIKKSFRSKKVDCVLAQYGTTGVAILPVCKALRLPLVVHFHGYDAAKHEVLERYKEGYQVMFDYAMRIIAVSNAMYGKLMDLGCPKDKLVLNTYGPNDAFLDIAPSLEKKHIVGIGRFTDKKAPYYTILAFSEVLKKFPEARLTIGGDGELLNTCRNLVKYLEIEDAVALPGRITPQAFQDMLKSAVAFVQHSIVAENGDSEGTPLAILESSAAGLPVISTKHAGIPDVVLDGVTGFLVDEHDVNGMAKAMMNILVDIDSARKMGAAGKQRIKNHFSMEQYINKLTEEITIAIDKSR